MLPLVFGVSIFGLLFAFFLTKYVLRQDTGNDKMRAISDAIREGANAFMKRQYTMIAILAAVVAILIFVLYTIFPNKDYPDYAWKTALSFIIGAACSAIAGFVGMYVSVRANIRVASAAVTSLNTALRSEEHTSELK